ncbi:calcium-activated potassium channel slo-1 [Ditylenchus destructor]|nr:calcium-activated potassium channel slo-1 [Ditylenchus destructor]
MDQAEAYFGINSSMTFDSGNTTGNLSEFYLSLSEDERKCLEDRKYFAFLCSSIGSFVVILLSVIIGRAVRNMCFKLRYRSVVTHTDEELTPGLEMQQIEEVNHSGRIHFWGGDHFLIETCKPFSENWTQQIDLGLNIFFLAFFVKRLLDAPSKVALMFDFSTFIDFFLIPPSFLAIFMERSWIGVRCCASLRLMYVPVFLFNLSIIKTNAAYNVVRTFVIYFTTPMVFYAGMIHLCENMGDPWTEFTNAHHLSYLECLYSVIVAFLTVGFKHSYCRTVLGRSILIYMVLTSIAQQIFNYVRARQQRRRIAEGSKDEPVNV